MGGGAGRGGGTRGGGAGVPGLPGATPGGRGGGATGGRGAPITFERRHTSKSRLAIDWDFPASLDLQVDDGGTGTRAVPRMYALTRDDAFARLAGKDRRPLLVMRECNRCKGTDDALLSRTLDNEKTLLLARWFHCVKLKPNVLDETHTYRRLFPEHHPPHLFLSLADGSSYHPLSGAHSQTELWHAMDDLLQVAYQRDVDRATKDLVRVLNRYDHLDAMIDQIREQMEAELEKHGPRSSKLKHLRKKLARYQAEMNDEQAREKKVSDLGLRTAETPANGSR